MKDRKVIIGAGLAGLIAAHAFPKATVYDSATKPVESHKALLRFRSDAVSRLTGIPFRKVLVRKSIFSEGRHASPNLHLANLYSQKLFGAGVVGYERSIWNLDPVERFIAPEDFYALLVDAVSGRCVWGVQVGFSDLQDRSLSFISTMPLPKLLDALHKKPPAHIEFRFAGIHVQRARIRGADAFQTVYFPDVSTQVYRASITGSLLIVESTGNLTSADAQMVMDAFGLPPSAAETVSVSTTQRYGKILPIDNQTRKALLFNLTHEHGIYSLGRFATWRNILLDDVVQDAKIIETMIAGDSYDLRRRAT